MGAPTRRVVLIVILNFERVRPPTRTVVLILFFEFRASRAP
jgi:hypothetical protein